MWTVLVVHLSCLWVLAIPALAEHYLSCHSQGCLCSGTASAVLYCNSTQNVFHIPRDIVTYLKHVKITVTNYSVDIPDQNYDNSWSVLETFEIYGDGGRGQQLALPYKFTKKLSLLKLLRIRNAGLVSIERSAFSQLNAMVELDLSNNEFLSVKEVEKAFFSGYSANKLETLNISGIHSSRTMRPITSTELSPLKSLLNLDISWTRADFQNELGTPSIPYVYFLIYNIIPNIVTLNMSGTQSYSDCDQTNCIFRMSIFNILRNLKVLRLDYWAAVQFDSNGTVSALPCTDLFAFEHGCYRLPARLKELYLNYAYAKKFYIDFEKDVCISSKLEHLSLRNLTVSGPIGRITGLHHLKSLDVSNTGIPFNLKLLFDMPSLEGLDASANSLYKIEKESGFADMFTKNIGLKEVRLCENGFLALPNNLFSQNRLLESIDISRNRLQYLKLNLTACLHLQRLSVANNRLKMIDSSVINHLDSPVTVTHNKVSITIDFYEITCSCEGGVSAAWIEKTTVTVIANEEQNFTCDTGERQEYMNNYNSTILNCSNKNKTLNIAIAIPETMIDAKKTELFYLIGGVLGCALCFFITIFLKQKYGSRRLPELQECSLQARIVENDEDRQFASYGEEQSNISNDTELDNTSEDKGPHNKVSSKYSREMSAYFLNADEPQSNGSELYRRGISVPDSVRVLNSLEPQNNVSVLYHSQFPVSTRVSHVKDMRDDESETHKKHVSVPDSIYFIGLSETPFESISRKPHFAAFLAYSHHDKDFVVSKLYRMLQRLLEKYIPSWNQELLTVLYDKNFLPGQCTMDLTRAAVFNSYVTVAIVSDSFIKSSWCHYEMEAAIEAKVPIISVYLPSSDTDKFPAILKYIYHNHVRIFWPDTADNLLELSDEEACIIRDLAFSISTYVKQPES